MTKILKQTEKKLSTPDKPYGLVNGDIWLLPFDKGADGSKHGTVIAELEDGYRK